MCRKHPFGARIILVVVSESDWFSAHFIFRFMSRYVCFFHKIPLKKKVEQKPNQVILRFGFFLGQHKHGCFFFPKTGCFLCLEADQVGAVAAALHGRLAQGRLRGGHRGAGALHRAGRAARHGPGLAGHRAIACDGQGLWLRHEERPWGRMESFNCSKREGNFH